MAESVTYARRAQPVEMRSATKLGEFVVWPGGSSGDNA
jgi:hypothetical protein